MLTLVLSTSTDQGSIGFLKKDKLLASSQWTRNKQNSEFVTFKIQSLIKTKKIKLKDIKQIIVDYGPGSFTGSRVGVTVAKTMSHSLKVNLHAVSSLDLMAADFFKIQKNKASLITILDAHKSLFYCREYFGDKNFWKATSSIKALSHDAILEIAKKSNAKLCGQFEKALKPIKLPHIKNTWTLVERKLIVSSTWLELEPLYIRNPDVLDQIQRLV